MSENASDDGEQKRGRRRGRPRRGKRKPQGSSNRPSKSGNNNKKSGKQQIKPSREASTAAALYFTGELNEFELFCAYHLGLDPQGKPGKFGLGHIARRFSVEIDDVKAALTEFKMDKDAISGTDFEPELARLDIKVAPPGIDRVQIALTLFQEFLDCGCGVGPVPEVSNGQSTSEE
ncbi:MAG: hypothetical protein KC561_02900 [Myxococcales bacterium]|nr:hypothetical protein [Myxococcales bacterium]